MATGESWNGIMHDCNISEQCIMLNRKVETDNETLPAGSYLNGGDSILATLEPQVYDDQCGSPIIVTVVYFITFVMLCAFVLLNLVIAVILDNFQASTESEEMPVASGHLLRYVESWGKLDPFATNYIPTVKLL